MDPIVSEKHCSRFKNHDECIRNCGVGVSHCQWRSDPGNQRGNHWQLSYSYPTCSSDLATCPDLKCDELETEVVSLCPQDCVGLFSKTK